MKFVTVTVTLRLFEQPPDMGASATVSALSELLATQPLSARDAAKKADDRGIRLPVGTIAAYWSGRHGRPSPQTLERLAQVVDIPLAKLQEAAWGTAAPLGDYAPPAEAALLDERQRRAIDEVIRSMVRFDPAAGSATFVVAGMEEFAKGSPKNARNRTEEALVRMIVEAVGRQGSVDVERVDGEDGRVDLARTKQASSSARGRRSDYDLAAGDRISMGKTREQVEYERHAAAGEESQDQGGE